MQLPALVQAAQAARAIAQAGGDSVGQNIKQQKPSDVALYGYKGQLANKVLIAFNELQKLNIKNVLHIL